MVGLNLELSPKVLLTQLQSILLHSYPKNNVSRINILVAYSGGLDSHVLLHLLSQLSTPNINLRAIYVNHGLQVEAGAWAHHCENICESLNVPFQSIDLNLSVAKGESTEEVARKFRYQALADNILDDEILLTAHHQNDQAETLLLQLFRGAGVQGLASMPVLNKFNASKNLHVRPLLGFSREALETYAKKHHLQFVEDPSNQDTAFDRNFLRQKILPQLREQWLGLDKTISRAASIQGETKILLDEYAAEELPKVLSKEAYFAESINTLSLAPINLSALKELSPAKQRLVLRFWISQQGFSNPSDKKMMHIFRDLIDAAEDKQPLIEWAGAELRRYQDCLHIMHPLSEHDVSQILDWNTKETLQVKSLGIELDSKLLFDKIMEDSKNVTVRFRQGGEKIDIPKRGRISLKNLFQEKEVPTWIRSRLPLIYADDKLVNIVNLENYKRHPPTY